MLDLISYNLKSTGEMLSITTEHLYYVIQHPSVVVAVYAGSAMDSMETAPTEQCSRS